MKNGRKLKRNIVTLNIPQTWHSLLLLRLTLEQMARNVDTIKSATEAIFILKFKTKHYLLHCPNYINIRARTILTLPSSQTNIRTLLYGNLDLRLPENKHIFLTVHEFIKLSKRL